MEDEDSCRTDSYPENSIEAEDKEESELDALNKMRSSLAKSTRLPAEYPLSQTSQRSTDQNNFQKSRQDTS